MRRTGLPALVLAVVVACGGDDPPASPDAAVVDGPVADAAPDASAPDASAPDAGAPDASAPDAGGDAGTTSNPGFPTPTAITRANVRTGGVWNEVGDADWTCLGTATTDLPATGPIALAGTVENYQLGDGVGAAQVTAFPMLTPATALGTATSSTTPATRGDFAMTVAALPAGVRRYGFTVAAAGYLTTYVVARYLTPGAAQTITLRAMAESTANALPAFVGVARDPSKAMAIGEMVDCQGRAVSNAVASR